MNGIKEIAANVRVITPETDDCFFGYYDLNAYDSTGTRHLCHQVPFIDHIPEKDAVAKLGFVTEQGFESFAETTAWNFQQGAMLQFLGDSDEVVCYNQREEDHYVTVIHNIATGEKRKLPMASACVSPDGNYALSINFNRIFGFRAGYGYSGVEDAYADQIRPEEDGVFLMDTRTGSCKLIIDYERMYREFQIRGLEQEKLVVNHITFNATSDRFLFLLRNFPSESGTAWGTTLITSDLEGNMHLLLENRFVSHYCWKNSNQILAFCAPEEERGLFLLDDLTGQYIQLPAPYPEGPSGGDIHCLYSPDKRFILGDGYADAEGYRPLFLYDTQTDRTWKLLKSKSTLDRNWDIRCDLHARFNRQGDKVSFDSAHDGRRRICEIDLTPFL